MKENTRAVALCGVLTGLGTAVMLAGGVIPAMTYFLPVVAGLLLIPVLHEYGKGRAWMVWGATSVLSLVLCADKEAAFFYLFLGYYPILKRRVDRIRWKAARLLVKLLFFAAALLLMYGLLYFVLGLESVVNDINEAGAVVNAVLYLILVAVMMVFDLTVERMTLLYVRRLRPKITFLK